MPHLTRLRFVSLGHPDARMPDLTLDFRDREGRPVDSTLWLRNGGGKSSILNLFFALVRPDRREFLGGKAEGKQRQLEHYIPSQDRGVMIAEWDLGGADLYLTGVFYEWQDAGLRRFFFAARSAAPIAIDTLPLHIEGADGRKSRRTLAGFRSEWQTLRNQLPQQQLVSTENQSEWKTILAGAGIDHELFSYQVRMNEREGGADSLFRFRDTENFVDFLLELVLDPSYGDAVGQNLQAFREELLDRKARHLPERDLCRGLAERLLPLVDVAGERRILDSRRKSLVVRTHRLKRLLEVRSSEIQKEIDSLTRHLVAQKRIVEEAAREALALRVRGAAFRRHAHRAALRDAEKILEGAQKAHEDSIRRTALLEAGRPLYQALRHERVVEELEAEIGRRQEVHRPLLEELRKAATGYGAALLHRKVECERKESLADLREREERACGEEDRRLASDANLELGRVQSELGNLEDLLEEARRSRERLEFEGVLLPGETAHDARRRAETSITEQEDLARRSEAEAKRIASEIETVILAIKTASSEESACTTLEAEGRKRLTADLQEKSTLEARAVLLRCLEAEAIDLDRLDEDLLRRLDEARQRLEERIAALRAEMAEDERAVTALENGGLLPPSPDVERLLDQLKKSIRGAWPGWLAIEANFPSDRRRALVERLPHLATGIIVRDDQFEKAVAWLRSTGVMPDQPILICPQGALHGSPSSQDGIVLGPASDAFFDKAAGAHELARRRNSLDGRRSDLESRMAELEDLTDALSRARRFRQTRPPGWLAVESERLDSLVRRAAGLAEAQRNLQLRESDLKRDRSAEEVRARQIREAVHVIRLCRRSLDDHHERYESRAQDREVRRQKCIARTVEIAATRKALLESGAAHDVEAGKAVGERRGAAEDIARTGILLSQIGYLPAEIRPEPGPVDILRDRYELLKAEYEGKLGEEGLRQRIDENRNNAAAHRKLFARSGQKEQDVRQAIETVGDVEQLEDLLKDARTSQMSLMGQVSNHKRERDDRKAKLSDIERICLELGGVPEPGDIPEHPDEEAARCDDDAKAQEAIAQESKERAQEAADRIKDRERDATIMQGDRKELSRIEENYADLLAAELVGEEIEAPERAVADLLDELATELRQVREARQDFDRRRGESVRGIRRWIDEPRFKVLDSTLARRLLHIEESGIEEQAAVYAAELELRTKTIDDQLGKIDAHRDLVVGELQQATEEALGLLRSASNHSRLPESVPGLAGKQFLRISLGGPADPAQRRAKLAELMDEIVEQRQSPSGLELVQRAVRRVARPVGVRILHPDPEYPKETVEITEMALFSGGEQLTGAILLYCTLAQLRLKRRGTLNRPSSALILDNPIGKSSSVRFLQLQREVARAMGVQLIYTTAVNDHDALATLPNVIRLRNERQDRNTGHRVIEHEQGLEAVRIVRVESTNDRVPSS